MHNIMSSDEISCRIIKAETQTLSLRVMYEKLEITPHKNRYVPLIDSLVPT